MIHGRAPAIATGLAVTQPDLDVWVVPVTGRAVHSGTTDSRSSSQRNVDNPVFNNTDLRTHEGADLPDLRAGKVAKSTRSGSLETPFNPISLALGAEATFVARTHDMDRKHMQETFGRAHEQRRCGLRRDLPELQRVQRRCLREDLQAAYGRADNLIPLVHGEPIRFGAAGEHGVVMEGDGRMRLCEVAGGGGGEAAGARRAS